MAKISLASLQVMKRNGEKITCLTAYDASFARMIDAAGVEVILVGDSLGMVIQGHPTTLEVKMTDMLYHSAQVARGATQSFLVVDLPFMSYATPLQTLRNAARLISEGGAHMVKLEGGQWLAESVRLLSERGIPVCAHLGLQPQSIHKLGGYRVQGRNQADAERIRADALVLQEAGAMLLVLECVPRGLAAAITAELTIPIIGIGAGKDCDGQVLVLYDILGISPKQPIFSRDFLAGQGSIASAITAYVKAVKCGAFPQPEHGFDGC